MDPQLIGQLGIYGPLGIIAAIETWALYRIWLAKERAGEMHAQEIRNLNDAHAKQLQTMMDRHVEKAEKNAEKNAELAGRVVTALEAAARRTRRRLEEDDERSE